MHLTDVEQAVLNQYRIEDEWSDSEGALGLPTYYSTIIAAAGGNADAAYLACRALKKAGMLEASGRQGPRLVDAPCYWITDAGRAALAAL